MCGSVTCDTPVINSTIQILSWVSDQSESDRSEINLRFDLAGITKQIHRILLATDHTLVARLEPQHWPNTGQ